MNIYSKSMKHQSGAILFVGLIFLIILSLLGFTALRTATMQERMAGNMRDRSIAFQAAESALRAAEVYLGTSPALGDATVTVAKACTLGAFKVDGDGVPYFVSQSTTFTGGSATWDGANPEFWDEWPWETANCFHTTNVDYIAAGDYGKAGKPIATPRYVIEEVAKTPSTGASVYRVTALGFGSSKNSRVVLQATYVSN